MNQRSPEDGIDTYTDENISLTDKYKKFVYIGFFRELVSNSISLLSYLVIARIVVIDVQDKMFFLTNGLFITGNIALMGYTYSLTRKAFVDKHLNSKILYEGSSFLFLVGLPLSFLLNIIIGLLAGVDPFQLSVFLISAILYFIYVTIQLIENIILQSNRQVLIQTMFNVVNSLSVPILYFYFRSLNIIFIAWIFSLSIPLIYERKILIRLLKNIQFNLKVNYDIFIYGFPIYLISIYGILSTKVDSFILLLYFPTGSLAEYTWAFRIAETVLDLFTVLLTGTFPLLTAFYVRKNYSQFNETFKSIIKIGVVIGLFLFGISFIEADFGIPFVISDKFVNSPLFFKILMVGYFIRTIPLIINQVFLARGNRRFIVEVSLVLNSSRILYLVLFAYLGGLGMAIVETLYSATFLALNSFKERKLMTELIASSTKLILFFVIMILVIFFFPTFKSISMSFMTGVAFVIIFTSLLIIFKPFNNSDFTLIEKVIGKRFKINLIIKKLLVSS